MKMLLYDLIDRCNYRNGAETDHEQCVDCSFGDNCPHDCKK